MSMPINGNYDAWLLQQQQLNGVNGTQPAGVQGTDAEAAAVDTGLGLEGSGDVAQGTDLGISVYSKDYTDINYVSDKFVIYNNKELEKSLCKKFLKKCELSHWKTFLGEGDFILNTSHVHGHVGNKDFTNLLCMRYTDALKVKKTADVRSCQFRFRTENERKNFFEAYMNSKCIHWWNLQWKNQIILDLKYIPYMSDYTQPWTDKRFCEYFEITGYIDDEHAEPGSEWEIILKTMEQYK